MDFLYRLHPIGDAVILIVCLLPMAVNIYTLFKPKKNRRVTKESIISAFALTILGYLLIFFRN